MACRLFGVSSKIMYHIFILNLTCHCLKGDFVKWVQLMWIQNIKMIISFFRSNRKNLWRFLQVHVLFMDNREKRPIRGTNENEEAEITFFLKILVFVILRILYVIFPQMNTHVATFIILASIWYITWQYCAIRTWRKNNIKKVHSRRSCISLIHLVSF